MSRRRPLRELYSELNEQHWGGRLPQPLLRMTYYGERYNGPRGILGRRVGFRASLGRHGPISKLRGPGGRGCLGIFLSPGGFFPAQIRVLSPLEESLEHRILIHEIGHCALFYADPERARVENPHGDRFGAELERIGAIDVLGEMMATEETERHELVAAVEEARP